MEELADGNHLHVFIISDQQHEQQEASLYDVLIQLKNKYPEHLTEVSLVTVEEANALQESDQISNYPAIIVTGSGQTLGVFSGEALREDRLFNRLDSILRSYDNRTSF